MKVEFTKLNSANVSVDNLVDETRKYDISEKKKKEEKEKEEKKKKKKDKNKKNKK